MVRATRRRHRHAGRAGPRAHVHRNGARGAIRRDVARRRPCDHPGTMCGRSGSSRAGDCASEDRGGHESGLGPRVTARDRSTIARCKAKLEAARSVAEIVVIEAKAASVYWRSWRDLGLIARRGHDLPQSWRRFANRNKGAEFLGNKHASPSDIRDDQLLHRRRGRAIGAGARRRGHGVANRVPARRQAWAQFSRLGLHRTVAGEDQCARVRVHSLTRVQPKRLSGERASTFIASRGRSSVSF